MSSLSIAQIGAQSILRICSIIFSVSLLQAYGATEQGTQNTPSISASALPAEKITAAALEDGRPAAWLTIGPWAGRAGLTLWGLDYESKIRPNPDDSGILTSFDTVKPSQWQPLKIGQDKIYKTSPLVSDYIWARGAYYAHIYIKSDREQSALMQLAQSGISSEAWLDGKAIQSTSSQPMQAERLDKLEPTRGAIVTDKNDQGGRVETQIIKAEAPQAYPLKLKPGWNRLLVKLIFQLHKGELPAFKTRFTAIDGTSLQKIETSLFDPEPTQVSRAIAARIIPTVTTEVPFNLAYENQPLKLTVNLGKVCYAGKQISPSDAFSGTLELIVTDYDGKELLKRQTAGTFPSDVVFDLGKAPAPGYYATHLKLLDHDGNIVTVYPPDGFNVIRGTAAQKERRAAKKMAVTYYFMAGRDLYKTLFFPYMQRLGIFRNIGGNNARALEFYKMAQVENLFVAADMWSYRDPNYINAYVQETYPYVDSFKAYNEIDIVPAQRGTPESWVKKAKLEYETIRKYTSTATVLGGSLVRPAGDDWFAECIKLGLDKYQDVWDVHCYPSSPPRLGGSMANSPNETELGVLKVFQKLGLKNTKPFWIGETGARCSHGADARRWQADMVAKMTACALSHDDFQKIGFLIPWEYSRKKGKLNDIETGHMPAESAYYTASALIDGFSYKRLDYGKSVQAAQFGPTLMLWREAGESRLVVQLEPKKDYILVDVVGRVSPIELNQKGRADIKITASPVYILLKSDYEKLTAF
jgi:hypothetical protein